VARGLEEGVECRVEPREPRIKMDEHKINTGGVAHGDRPGRSSAGMHRRSARVPAGRRTSRRPGTCPRPARQRRNGWRENGRRNQKRITGWRRCGSRTRSTTPSSHRPARAD